MQYLISRKSFYGSSFIESLIQKKHFTQIKMETSVIHIFDEGLTAFIVVQF